MFTFKKAACAKPYVETLKTITINLNQRKEICRKQNYQIFSLCLKPFVELILLLAFFSFF